MAKKKAVQLNEDTAAAQSIEAKPSDASRASMMLDIMNLCGSLDKSTLEATLAQIGKEAKDIPEGAAASNRASVAAKGDAKSVVTQAMKEDIAELFGSADLTEEFKEKTAVLFEAAVNARVLVVESELQEQYEAKLVEEVKTISEATIDQVDQYLSRTAEKWLEDNQVAIDKSLATEVVEGFMTGLHQLFTEHYVTVPEGKVDVVEALTARVDELETLYNEQTQQVIEMTEALEKKSQEETFAEVAEGLALTQVDKLKKLCEGVEFNDADSYKSKLTIIREHHFPVKRSPGPQTLLEQTTGDEPADQTVKFNDPSIKSYYAAISRTIKK